MDSLEAIAVDQFSNLFSRVEGLALNQRLEQQIQFCLEQPGQEWSNRISQAAERMESMIQGLLAYNRLSLPNLSLQPLNLNSVVNEALAQLELQIQQTQAQITVETPLLQMVGHYPTMVQVVANLLTNAIKFIPPGIQPQVRLWTEQRDQQVRLWVEDNGIGIAPENQNRIFRVFERLHAEETYPGTGIGLAIVRRALERMHGQTNVESNLGAGSRFWIELPAASEF